MTCLLFLLMFMKLFIFGSMKITIDDQSKTIEIEEDVNLNELFEFLTERNIDFKEYSILRKKVEYLYYPTYPVYPPPPVYPWDPTTVSVTCT